MIRDDVFQLREPKQRYLRQEFSLVGYSLHKDQSWCQGEKYLWRPGESADVSEYHIVCGYSVGCYEEEEVGRGGLVDVADFAFCEELQARKIGVGEGGHDERVERDKINTCGHEYIYLCPSFSLLPPLPSPSTLFGGRLCYSLQDGLAQWNKTLFSLFRTLPHHLTDIRLVLVLANDNGKLSASNAA